MLYLITQMLFCLLIAAALGGIVGWVAKGLRAARELHRSEEAWGERLRQSGARAGGYKNQLAEVKQTEENLRSELRLAENAEDRSGPRLAADNETIEALQAELAGRDKKIDLLRLQISQSEAAVSSEWESLKARKTEIAERQRRLDSHGKKRDAEWSGKLKQSQELRQKLQEQLALLKRRQGHLEGELETLRLTHIEHGRRSGARAAELEAELEKQRDELADRDASIARLNEPRKRTGGHAKTPAEKDDLEKIKGIGPVLSRKLNELGVHRFQQIASWTEDDVNWAASKVGSSSARIRSAGWVESAAKLHQAKQPKRPRARRRASKKS